MTSHVYFEVAVFMIGKLNTGAIWIFYCTN